MLAATVSSRWNALAATIVVLIVAALAPSPAAADIGPELVRFGESGAGAGQLDLVVTGGGIDADPLSGHLFVADHGNHRISEFTAWGDFVKSWGWGVRDGTAAPQTCTGQTGCMRGLPGSAAGQFRNPDGIALDLAGNISVFEGDNHRVQVFDPSGEFVRMIGGGVNHTTGADTCTEADEQAGDICGAGVAGTGPSEFSVGPGLDGDFIDVGPDGTVYVADKGRIQEFGADGSYSGEIAFASVHAEYPAFPENLEPGALTVDPVSGDIYLAFDYPFGGSGLTVTTWRLTVAGAVVPPAPLLTTALSAEERVSTESMATDPVGNLYLGVDPIFVDGGSPSRTPHLLEIGPLGERLANCCASPNEYSTPGLAVNTVTAAGGVDVYALHSTYAFLSSSFDFVEVRGPAPDLWPPPTVPPTIDSQFVTSVNSESASLRARINPNFWADTRYHVEYGLSDCSAGGCQSMPAAPGNLLGAGITKALATTKSLVLSGLQPGTTYHYRFVAESGGGGPVFGPDRTFTTFSLGSAPDSACANASLRTGDAAALPDCRAYEMVSPVDKLGGDLVVQRQSTGIPARLQQSTPSGEKITYSASRAFGDSQGSPYTAQYLAARGTNGWSTDGISPPRKSGVYSSRGLDVPFKAFSEDLASGWLSEDSEDLLAPGAVPGFANLYRRDNLRGDYEALTTVSPSNIDRAIYYPELEGISGDGERVVFSAPAALTPNASTKEEGSLTQLYESHHGDLSLVSVRPNGSASTIKSVLGWKETLLTNSREGNVDNAISDDGSRIYWSERVNSALGGKLYLRIEGAETVAVSPGSTAKFWAATPSGDKAVYTEGKELALYDLQTRESTKLADSVLGVLGAGEDLSRVYFLSTAVAAGGATAGQPNLYFYEDGAPLRFLATLSSSDLSLPSPIAVAPGLRVSRVTPDGMSAVFMSRAALTGADNLDAATEQPDAEVYRYGAAEDRLLCVSCSPTGGRPSGAQYIGNLESSLQNKGYRFASKIPGWELQNHAPRALTDDGNRVFFDSLNRLTLADTNGKQDVYQWEAPGSGECREGGFGFNPEAGGCVTLVSSGQGGGSSEFVDAGADGRDVFFLTGDSLLPQDPGQIDLYDARAGGGFPPPPAPPAECEGDACQNPAIPPPPPSLSSQSFKGAGNPVAAKQKKQRKRAKHGRKHRRKGHGKAHQKRGKGQHAARGGRR